MCKPVGEPSRVFVVQQVRYMERTFDLLSEDAKHSGVFIAQRVDPYSSQKVQVAFVARVEEVSAAAPVDEQIVAPIGLKQTPFFKRLDV